MATSRVAMGRHYLRRDGRSFFPVGAHVVPPGGPDWPWREDEAAFESAFGRMRAIGLDTARIDLLWAAIEPEPGRFDAAHLAALDRILAAARRTGLLLHPTLFIGGEVGDAFWDPPWRAGRHPHADPELVRLQAEHAAMLGGRWRSDPAILAWDLTDEPPYWIAPRTSDEDAGSWTTAIADALRAADPDHLVTIGTSGQESGWGPFRADVVAERLDFGCVHPYPIYQPELYPDTLLASRMTHAAAFETALAAGAGRPVMLHEYGASSAQFDPERIAAFDRLAAWSALGRGAIGALAWCWTDASPDAYGRVPYARQPHETQFGLTDASGALRPRGQVLAELAATVRHLPLDALAADGQIADAAIIVPHEYVRPYDPAALRPGGEGIGPYRPAERDWDPERDAAPLVRAWLNAFVLASRAGIRATFAREALDDRWPAASIVLLPAPLTASASSLHHVRTSLWRGAADHAARGGALWLSCSAETAIPELADIAGCLIVDRARADRPHVLRFVRPWGPFGVGDELSLPDAGPALWARDVMLDPTHAETVALDADGRPALLVSRRSAGTVAICAQPIESLLARMPDAHGPTDRSWGLYAGLVEEAGLSRRVAVPHPDVAVGELRGPEGGLAVITNHGPSALTVPLRLPDGSSAAQRFGPQGAAPVAVEGTSVEVELEAYDATIVGWRGSRQER